MSGGAGTEVNHEVLTTATQAAEDISQELADVVGEFEAAIDAVRTGARGTDTADAADRMGNEWDGRVEKRVEELRDLADRLGGVGSNYTGMEANASGLLGGIGGGDRDGDGRHSDKVFDRSVFLDEDRDRPRPPKAGTHESTGHTGPNAESGQGTDPNAKNPT